MITVVNETGLGARGPTPIGDSAASRAEFSWHPHSSRIYRALPALAVYPCSLPFSLSLPLSLPHSPVAPLADNYEDIIRTGEQGQTGHESLHAGMIIGVTEGAGILYCFCSCDDLNIDVNTYCTAVYLGDCLWLEVHGWTEDFTLGCMHI